MCDFTVLQIGLYIYTHIYCSVGIRILRMKPVATPAVLTLDADMISCSMDSAIIQTGGLPLFILTGQWPAADKSLAWQKG